MGRIRRTLVLAKSSWRVIQHDRELLVLPVLSFLISAAVLVPLVILAVLVSDTSSSTDTAGEESGDPAMLVIGAVAFVAVTIVSVFFNGALVAGANERFRGGNPTVGSAMRRAVARIPGLVPWALLTATVGLVLQALRERAGRLGQFVVDLIGTAWDVATFLVVPAVVIDELGAVDGLKRSGSLLRETWGENIAARIGFGLLGFLLVIPGAVIGGLGIAAGGPLLVIGIAIAVAWIAVVVVVMSALSAVFQTALYLYATTGTMPSGFEDADLQGTFEPR